MTNKETEIKYDKCPPNASAMIQSMRAFGYDLSMAVADIVDNSISAGAKNIWVTQNWAGADSYIAILDDGFGMKESVLVEAMRLGTQSPLEERDPNDLGRFGFGLKTASFSQCRLLTVRTKTKEGEISTRCWDIDYVTDTKEWRLLKTTSKTDEKILKPLEKLVSGTIVLWQKLDRIVESDDAEDEQGKNHFLRRIDGARKYLEMVFHRYIGFGGKTNIYISSPENFGEEFTKLKPWDPFFTVHSATQELSNEAVHLFGNKIRVRPFVLPHISKLSPKEHNDASGLKGWNSQQGFYIYRKERLIVAGSWLDLGLKQEEHCKLARIQVDIPNNMDHEWKIDVKKAEAHPPDALRSAFQKIAKLTRERAVQVYRHRGKVELRNDDNVNRFVWKKINNRGKISYKIDCDHPVIAELLEKTKSVRKDINSLIKLVEGTVPIEQIVITNAEDPDAHIKIEALTDCEEMPIKKWFMDQVKIQIKKGLSREEAAKIVLTMEPFNQYPELISLIEESR